MIPIRRALRLAGRASRVVWRDVRNSCLGQVWPLKPVTVNFLANDICNSRCQMCRIWQKKRDNEITADELERILSDPLFRRVRYVGVSGGEPTLRKDLPQIFEALVGKRPKLTGTGIITNAIRAGDVINRVTAAAEICREGGISFGLMVSLDGVGEVHDRIRGREGNFDSVMEVIGHFREKTEIPLSFGCTISKDNVWHVDQLLDFAIREGLYGRFRVAEFIFRLYNEEETGVIRNFSPSEAYHLGLFFARLERTYERNPTVQRTYRNIRAMLMQGAKRAIACPYQTQAVVLDSRGQLSYCSPKSPILGSALESPAERIYLDHIDTRRRILAQDCQDCIHDYHAAAKIDEMAQRAGAYWWQRQFAVRPSKVRRSSPPGRPSPELASPVRHALIVGWYGTETAGDKAILGGIVHDLKEQGAERITLASLHPYLSEWTVKELGCPEVEVIPTYSRQLLRAASSADETIMGGGPLMDVAALGAVQRAFVAAKKAGRRTRIEGCGIGPLRRLRYVQAVQQLIEQADVVALRDSSSVEWAVQNTARRDVRMSGDPAEQFVLRWQARQPSPGARQKTLNCYLREWTAEYKADLPVDEFEQVKVAFEAQLAKLVVLLCERLSLRPRLLAMHHFVIGGDDRVFNRRFAGEHLSHLDPIVEIRPFSVYEILESMREAATCLTMRYHSVLFAHTLGAPFVAVDYTRGGKVRNFLADRGALDRLLDFELLVEGQWQARIESMVQDERPAD